MWNKHGGPRKSAKDETLCDERKRGNNKIGIEFPIRWRPPIGRRKVTMKSLIDLRTPIGRRNFVGESLCRRRTLVWCWKIHLERLRLQNHKRLCSRGKNEILRSVITRDHVPNRIKAQFTPSSEDTITRVGKPTKTSNVVLCVRAIRTIARIPHGGINQIYKPTKSSCQEILYISIPESLLVVVEHQKLCRRQRKPNQSRLNSP